MSKNKKNRRNTFSILLKILLAIFLLLLLLCVIKTCKDCRDNRIVTTVKQRTGYQPENERWDSIPKVIPPYKEEDLDSLADKISLERFFPPIGNQNPYGTCVAWAVGYNLKTALNAIENHWDSIQLADPVNQTSPKDLYGGIPKDKKGKETINNPPCWGTQFEYAFEVLMDQGASNMKEVPYDNIQMCKLEIKGDESNKIVGFNHVIDTANVVTMDGQTYFLPNERQIKAYLKDTIPLAISARLGDNFMVWRDSNVLKDDTYIGRDTQHAYHAMVLSGYDDSKHAFRVRNSWGTDWGDSGSIWVDYDFFMNSFCRAVFVASNH